MSLTEPDRPFISINWKDTDACITLNCDCGGFVHEDGFFMYEIKCTDCGTVYKLPTQVKPQ